MKYEFQDRIDPASSHGKLISHIKPGSLVLECGCAGGYMTKYMKEQLNCSVYIVEYDQTGFDNAIQYAADGICADLMQNEWSDKFSDIRFDYIMFADVLEHLSDPLHVLRKVEALLKDDGVILVSLPNICHNDIAIKLLGGNWDYTSLGLLDDTHIHFWGINNLDTFFEQAGLRITIKDCTIVPTMSTEQFGGIETTLSEDVYSALKDRPAGEIYQFVLLAQKEAYVAENAIAQINNFPKASEFMQVDSLRNQLNDQKRIIADKDRHIQNLDMILAAKDQHIRDMGSWVSEKDRHISHLNQVIEQKDQHIDNLSAIKANSEQAIVNLEDQLHTVVEEVLQLREVAKQNEILSTDLNHYKTHYVASINQREDLKVQLAHYQGLYHAISNAAWWKITKPCRIVCDWGKRVLKSNRYTHLFCKGLKSLFRDGIKATWYKVKRKLRNQQDFQKARAPLYTEEELQAQKLVKYSKDIKFSILVPLYNTPEKFLREMIQSVQDQTYANWELCLADGSDDKHTDVGRICKHYAKKDPRIRYQKLEKNLGISGNTNACIDMAQGDYISLFDHDDLLHPAALFATMKAICEEGADFIYTDENTFHNTPADAFCPHFKPDFAPDTLRANNYICHFTSFKRSLIDVVGKFRPECDGSQDFDMVLRLTEKAEKIVHIPQILYYWRAHAGSVADSVGAKPYVIEAAKRAIGDHLERVGLKGEVLDSVVPSMYRIRYELDSEPLVSIIIPNYEHKNELKVCLDSIFDKSTYKNFEVIIVENNSKSDEIFRYYEEIQKKWENLKVVVWDSYFNYSAINNYGAQFAKGEHLLLLNNDTEIISPDWIQEMLMYSQRSDVGAVGAKLYYPDNTIQHAGLGIGLLTLAGHLHRNFDRNHPGYMGRLIYAQDLSGVTAACVMIRRDVWEEIDGLDETFEVAFNDVDMCMRIRRAGYLIVWTPFAELYHYESKSRGLEDTPEKQKRFLGEVSRFQTRWAKELADGDPYYNPNFSLDKEDFSIRES